MKKTNRKNRRISKRKSLRKRNHKRNYKGGANHPLTLYSPNFSRIRLGRPGDGGYVIYEIPNITYDLLLGGGIAGDTSFEDDFLNKFPNVECYGFDGTIEAAPSTNTRFHFIKKNIGANNTDSITNLHDYLEKYSNVFVKMDIEGGEFEWLNSLTPSHMNNIAQMVIEFHFVQPYGPVLTKEGLSLFENINKTHTLVNFHGNSWAGIQDESYLGFKIPSVPECLYINNKYLKLPLELNKLPIPLPLDQSNSSGPDIVIEYPPFVNK